MSIARQDMAALLPQAPAAGQPRYRQAIALAVLSPVVAELLSSSAPPTAFFVPWVFALFVFFYGTAALLIRELSVRWGGGWASILLMGAAFGILQEGCATRAFFDPTWRSLGPLTGVGRWAGVNWIWTADAILYHAVFSTALPILLVYQLFPSSKRQAWLKRPEMLVVAVFFGLALTVFLRAGSKYSVPASYLAACVVVVLILLVVAARIKPRTYRARRRAPVPSKWFAVLGCFVTVGQVFQIYFAPRIGGAVLSLVFLVALVIVPWRLLVSWTDRGHSWSREQQYALLAGALGSFAVMDFLQEFNPTRVDNMRGVSLVGAGALAGLIWMGRRLRHSPAES